MHAQTIGIAPLFPPQPALVSYEAVLVVVNMAAMWLTAPCLVRPRIYYPRWLQRWGVVVFILSFAMMIVNLSFWMDTIPLFQQPWRGR